MTGQQLKARHTVNKEDFELGKINERRSALINAVSAIQERSRSAERRLAELQAKLGETILMAEMGEIPAADLLAIRQEMQALRAVIQDAELILEPARRREARLNGDEVKWSRLRPYRQEYEALKVKITEAGVASENEATKLREQCAMLDGNTSDADAVIAAAKQARAA